MDRYNEQRHDWTAAEIREIYDRPLLDLVYQAATVHRRWHRADEVQLATLLSVKTGGCPEDCAYCGQAARYHTGISVHGLLPVEQVVAHAEKAKVAGATRFCMAAAWRSVRDNCDFERVLTMVRAVNALGLETCCSLGMLTATQADKLKDAGLHAYNHNLDTSSGYYGQIISTRQLKDRLDTLANVQAAGIRVCCGGIIGLGERIEDRIDLLTMLANLDPHPESVPINALVRVKGTPLENLSKVDAWELVRMVATVRIVIPRAMVRLSAGRLEMTEAEQAMCFLAGANSIFTGEQRKLLVTPNPGIGDDLQLLGRLGLKPKPAPEENKTPAV